MWLPTRAGEPVYKTLKHGGIGFLALGYHSLYACRVQRVRRIPLVSVWGQVEHIWLSNSESRYAGLTGNVTAFLNQQKNYVL